MVCPTKTKKSAEILLDYCARTLTPPQQAEFEKHMQDCADCRLLVEAQRDLWETLERWTPAEACPDVSPDFDARLYARIAQEDAAPWWKQWWRRMSRPSAGYSFWKPAVPLAAACAVLAVGLVLHAPKPQDSSPQIHNERVDIEQVEKTLEDLDLLTPTQTPASPM